MVVTCDIQFERNPAAIYYAGQVIMGKVTLRADKIKQVKAVNLNMYGLAKTRWKENGSKHNNNENNNSTYWGQIDYIDTKTCLLAANTTDQAVIIEPGIHTFSFACHIPANCPSSFEGDYGSIRYLIKVSLVRPWKFEQTFTKAFTVLAVKDLNYDSPLLKLPVKSDISKVFCCGPLKSNPLQINVQLPQIGFVPGQLIPVSVLVSNETKTLINEICIRLVMMVNYLSSQPSQESKNETKIVSKLKGDQVLRNCKKNFDYLLPIPATPPTCSSPNSIIQIAYRVEVEVKMQSILNSNQFIHIPVTIGNVPLQPNGMVVQQQPMPKHSSVENGTQIPNDSIPQAKADHKYEPATSNENIEPWSSIGNILAPAYMEASHIPKGKLSDDVAHEYGEKLFAPKYPVFNIPGPTSWQSNSDVIDGHMSPPTETDPNKTTWL